eukprot:233870-Chlamydomonas_euryale.AAC.4
MGGWGGGHTCEEGCPRPRMQGGKAIIRPHLVCPIRERLCVMSNEHAGKCRENACAVTPKECAGMWSHTQGVCRDVPSHPRNVQGCAVTTKECAGMCRHNQGMCRDVPSHPRNVLVHNNIHRVGEWIDGWTDRRLDGLLR